MITVPSKEAMRNSNDTPDQRGGDESTPRGRLNSWKEIAAHFQRSVRCVQRWESTEGLPVLRHQHAAGATVYAYRDKLDEWLHEGRGVAYKSALVEGRDGRFLRMCKGLLRLMRLEPRFTTDLPFFCKMSCGHFDERGSCDHKARGKSEMG